MNELGSRVWTGSVAGFAACGPMTAFMEVAGRFLPSEDQEPLPPRRITERASDAVGVAGDVTEDQMAAATMAGHFGYGTSAGAVYGALAPHVLLPPAVRGVAFALGVWAGSYLGWLPTAGLYRPATRDSAGRNTVMIAAHAVWGAILGSVEHELSGRARSKEAR